MLIFSGGSNGNISKWERLQSNNFMYRYVTQKRVFKVTNQNRFKRVDYLLSCAILSLFKDLFLSSFFVYSYKSYDKPALNIESDSPIAFIYLVFQEYPPWFIGTSEIMVWIVLYTP